MPLSAVYVCAHFFVYCTAAAAVVVDDGFHAKDVAKGTRHNVERSGSADQIAIGQF